MTTVEKLERSIEAKPIYTAPTTKDRDEGKKVATTRRIHGGQ